MVLFGLSKAAATRRELLWPKGAPGAKGDGPADKPSLTWYCPAEGRGAGAAVVICPGGGYGNLSIQHEGEDVAQWLHAMGVTGIILRYRHGGSGYRHPIPLLDVQRAVSLVRSQAEALQIRPDRIGVLGFSAGGHLASTLTTHFHAGKPESTDPVDRGSCRPDFAVLIYPVITLADPYAHAVSRRNLLGATPDPNLIAALSNDRQVTGQTPPCFLVHGGTDAVVPVENSLMFYQALRTAKVPAELHIFREGKHGFWMGQGHGAVSLWPRLCEEWMRGQGLFEK